MGHSKETGDLYGLDTRLLLISFMVFYVLAGFDGVKPGRMCYQGLLQGVPTHIWLVACT